MKESDFKEKIFDIFSQIANSIGYSPLHGKIIGVLIVRNGPVSLQSVAEDTGYSASMISLSLDFLEILGVIRKVKKSGDRKLYIELTGDLLECLKTAIVLRVQKGTQQALEEFELSKKNLSELPAEKREVYGQTISVLESEIKRLEKYINLLAGIKLPKT